MELPVLNDEQKIQFAEKEMMKLPQVSCPVVHSFGPGVYIRQVSMPAGTLAIGHHQNETHMNVFVKGKVRMKQDDGTFIELEAPMSFVSGPGRKIGYILEDMVWLNVYATDETDVEKLEKRFLTKSDAFLESEQNQINHLLSYEGDKEDYFKAITELGFTEDQVRQMSEFQGDTIDLLGSYAVKVGKSRIEGKGLIATADFKSGEIIMPSRIEGKRTIAGRYTNHAKDPNAKMIADDRGNIFLFAIKDINGCRGGLDGYEITINYRDAVKLTRQLGENKCQE